MQEVNEEKKTSAIKTLAIIGFITAIVAGVWLAVQAVRLAPNAFQSLASLAEVVYSKDSRFVVSTEKNIVNTGENVVITWTKMRREGTYELSYKCTDGISAELRTKNDSLEKITCDTPVTLDADAEKAEVVFASEKKRFTDVPFTVRYTPAVNMEAREERTEMVTVVNVALAEERVGDTQDGEVAGADTAKDKDATEKPKEETATPKPVAKPVTTTPQPVVTTVIPVSNPNGYTDLATRFIAIGSFNESTSVFTPRSSLDNDMHGAVQFEVKNIGTKTSSNWTYHVTLPGEETDSYTSPSQLPLKPNERAVITIAFGDVTEDTGTKKIRVEVRGGNDSMTSNNTFSESVKVTD